MTNLTRLKAEQIDLRRKLANTRGLAVFQIIKDLELVTFQIHMIEDQTYRALLAKIPERSLTREA